MALKPTIYKAKIVLSDLNRDYYDTLHLTIAQHPSETLERMMVRVLAFCLNAQPNLTFTKGLSTPDEPDIMARDLSDAVTLWIDVGEPAVERTKKAARIAKTVKVYSFNTKANVWWSQNGAGFQALNVDVYQFHWDDVKALLTLVERTMDFSITVSGETVYVSAAAGDREVNFVVLNKASM